MKYHHSVGKYGPYFEGWYLKYRTEDGEALALIPAMHIDAKGRRSASVQVITAEGTWWLEYPETEAYARDSRFHVRVGENVFAQEGIWLNINCHGLCLRGTLRHGPFTPLRSDIMGPFRLVPGMECAHGVISMGHTLEGSLQLNGKELNFSGGRGYVETDRGRSFPRRYLWTQCAWETPKGGGLMLSIATIPVGSFTGCICAVMHEGREYRLATYRGVRVENWSGSGAVIRQGKYRIEVSVLEQQGRPLRAPVEGEMERIIHESLCAGVRCRFWSGKKLLFDHTDRCAGFEYADAGESQPG